jgi:hypothetical protein
MQTRPWLLLALAGCAGAEANPVMVAERFHEARVAGDHMGVHSLLSGADRAASPADAFPLALSPRLARLVALPGRADLDSAVVLKAGADTTTVVLHVAGLSPDTLLLVAEREVTGIWRFERERVHWRLALGIAEQALLDSLATALRAAAGAQDGGAADRARAYLATAERHPAMARPSDVDAARSLVRRAEAVAALQVDLRVTESFTGSRFVEGRIQNPTKTRISTLAIVVRDGAGAEERVVLWDLAPASTAAVRELTRLRRGSLTHRLDQVEIF